MPLVPCKSDSKVTDPPIINLEKPVTLSPLLSDAHIYTNLRIIRRFVPRSL
jgi:hypothetical protein